MFKHPLIDAIFELVLVNDKHQFVELHQNIEHAKAAMHSFDPTYYRVVPAPISSTNNSQISNRESKHGLAVKICQSSSNEHADLSFCLL